MTTNSLQTAKNAHAASLHLLSVSELTRKNVLQSIAQQLRLQKMVIIKANQLDLEQAAKNNLKSSLLDRLKLTERTIEQMASSCEQVANAPQVVGLIEDTTKRADGLIIQKQRIPIGVIALIFESRPNVVIEAAALAIKSGNALIFKGGSDALHSNAILFDVLIQSIKEQMPKFTIQMLETRESVDELLVLDQFINLVIPRGGEALVKHVKAKATMPVIAHDRGLCHLFVNIDADVETSVKIILNAKTSRPGVCNALETLLIHKGWKGQETLLKELTSKGVRLKLDEILYQKWKDKFLVELALESDFNQEWLDLVLSVKQVDSVEAAVDHIQKFGSHHTEAILSNDQQAISYFQNHLDASCIMVNASTRFNDGGELGLGAEMGISTSKLHAYGPMGAKELTTTRFLVVGTGHIR
jgi:glutamate-5-semialdehyde dehydrogenase